MMITSEGYTISEYPNKNKIEITLPQTFLTVTNTVAPIDNDRKDRLSEDDLTIILGVVKALYKSKGYNNIDSDEWLKSNGSEYGLSSRLPIGE